jgi:hypothetical protein
LAFKEPLSGKKRWTCISTTYDRSGDTGRRD